MWFTTFIVKNLTRRLMRSVLTVVSIAIAIGALLALVGIANGFEQTFLALYQNSGVDMVVVRGTRRQLNSTLDESLAEKIKKVPGVRDVFSGLGDMASVEGLYSVVIQGWEPETSVFDHVTVKEGRKLARGDTKAAMLGTLLASNLDKKIGDSIEVVEKETYQVVGIYESRNVYENGALVIPLKELQRIMDRPGKVTGFHLILDQKDPDTVQKIRRQIEALAPGLQALPVADHLKTITEIQLAKDMAWITSCIAVVVSFFSMTNTMLMSVHERTREIGILRAVGWQIPRVIRMIFLEAVFLSILGALCGMLGAVGMVQLLIRLPSASGLIDGRIEPILFVYAFLIAVGLGLVGSILPAIRAARMLPTEALHHE